MEKKINLLKNHIIVCGLGELGEEVVRNLKEQKEKFLVIESSLQKIERLQKQIGGFIYIADDASRQNVLENANIKQARTLISCMGSDSKNLFVVITAREINVSLIIVSEAVERDISDKLRRAGSNYVVTPSQIGGRRMACVATKPGIVSFLDVITATGEKELQLESVIIKKGSKVASKTLAELEIPHKTGLIVLSVRKKDTPQFIYNPSSDSQLDEGDEIIVMGQEENLIKLKDLVS